MIVDKEEPASLLIEPIVRQSKIVRASSLRTMRENLPQHVIEGMRLLNDAESIAVKRVVTFKYLDFPHVLRAGSVKGSVKIGSPINDSAIGEFLTAINDGDVFVFLEPWLIGGAALLSAKLLKSDFWTVSENFDHNLKIYDSGLTKSCILYGDDDDSDLNFVIAM